MDILKDITGAEYKISSNRAKKVFTIIKNGTKYKTNKFPYLEFATAVNFWTGNDWMNFLKQSNDYYIVK